MRTLKEFYETIEDDNSKNYDGFIKCETCRTVLIGEFTSLPDYEVAFCPIPKGHNYKCFESWVTDHIAGEADYLYEMSRERKLYDAATPEERKQVQKGGNQ